jgi:histidinol dehydrogenase
VLRRLDLRGAVPPAAEIRRLSPRAGVDVDQALDAIRSLGDDVPDARREAGPAARVTHR